MLGAPQGQPAGDAWTPLQVRVARAVAALGLLVVVVVAAAALALPPNMCDEGVESPAYTTVSLDGVTGFPVYYRLLEVAEAGAHRPTPPARRAPVLFVPGNAGSFTQAKSLAIEAAKAGLPLQFFAVDLGGELVAFRGQLLHRQSRFVSLCFGALRTRMAAEVSVPAHERAMPLLAVGHSMGGLVLRAALGAWGGDDQPLRLLLTLGTPHAAPVVATEAALCAFYAQLHANENLNVGGFLSVGGGERDMQVPLHLTELAPASTETKTAASHMQLAAQSIRGVLGSVDHQCLTWCLPMIHRLNEILVASAGAHGPRLDLPSLLAGAGTVWETPSLATLPRVSIWPGRPGFPSATVAIEFNDTASKGSSSSESTAGRFLLRLHSQLLSMPQKLTLRCSAPVGTPKLYAVSEGSTAFRLQLLPESIESDGLFTHLILTSAWAGRQLEQPTDALTGHDVSILVTGNVGGQCYISLTADVARATGQLGLTKPGILSSATIALLVFLQMGLSLGAVMLGTVTAVTITMLRYQVPLAKILQSNATDYLMLLCAEASAASTLALILLCMAKGARGIVRWFKLRSPARKTSRQCFGLLLVGFLLHPFETLLLCWIGHVSSVDPASETSSRDAMMGISTGACSDALLIALSVLKLPGSISKFTSSHGWLGPFQIAPVSHETWALLASSLADSAAAMTLARGGLRKVCRETPPVDKFSLHWWTLAAWGVALCGPELYAIPWVLALTGTELLSARLSGTPFDRKMKVNRRD